MINNDNYEGYLMRYADGELNDKEVAMVEAFLATHPELREELEAITAPSLKITPPLVTMPDKKALMQSVVSPISRKAIWRTIAAAVALLLAFGIVLKMGHHQENPIIAKNDVFKPISVTDSPLPDSLYIGRGKPAPLLLAKQHKAKEMVAENNSSLQQSSLEVNQDEEAPMNVMETTIEDIIEPLLANNSTSNNDDSQYVSPAQNMTNDSQNHTPDAQSISPVSRTTNLTVIETDQLVTLTPKPTDRHDLRVGNVIENNNIALAAEKGFIGKAIDAVTRFLMHRSEEGNEKCLAFSD